MFRQLLLKFKTWQLVSFTITLTLGLTVLCAVLVYLIEGPNPASPINTFFDSLYWAVGTLTRVGYGDLVPVTVVGKLASMILGLSSLVCTAVCMGWVVAKTTLRQG